MDGMPLDLQASVKAALEASAGLQALAGSAPMRIYQDVEADPVFPYITLGDDQENDDSVEHLDASEIFLDIHVWSRGPGYAECKRIAAEIRAALHDAELVLDENRCVLIEHRITRTFRDADGKTLHGVVTFRALTERV